MATTNFIDGSTVIMASWLNDIDAAIYQGTFGSVNISTTGSLSCGALSPSSISTSGTISCGALTSNGIDDNATAERLQVGNSEIIVGTTATNFTIAKPDTAAGLIIGGGNTAGNGSDIVVYGSTHGTTGDMLFRNGGNIFMNWDESAGSWSVNTGVGAKTNALTLDSSQAATFASNVYVDGGNIILDGSITASAAANGDGVIGVADSAGLVLRGKGSTNDIQIQNSSDLNVMVVPTGTQNVQFEGQVFSFGDTAPHKTHLSTLDVIELGVQSYLLGASDTGGSHFTRGVYHNGTNWVRSNTEEVSSFSLLGSGDIKLRGAAAGTAETTVTWIDYLTITASSNLVTTKGNLTVGDRTSASAACIVDGTATGDTSFQCRQAGALKGYMQYQDVGDQLVIDSDGTVVLASANTTALTVDTSQDVTFEGKAYVKGNQLTVGEDDSVAGNINLYGGLTGNEGGQLNLHTTADYDTTIDKFFLDAYQDTFRIVANGVGVGLTIDSSANSIFGGTSVTLSNVTSPSFLVTDTTNSITTRLQSTDTRGVVGTSTNHEFRIYTNDNTAVTFDTIQNATFTGTITGPASTTSRATMNIPHGSAPTSPANGDMWTTTAGLYVRINGSTVGPLS